MSISSDDIIYEDEVKENPFSKLIQKWKEEENLPKFNESEYLISLCECLEHEQTEFWGRCPDPLDDDVLGQASVAGLYGDIYAEIELSCDFIYNVTLKHIRRRTSNPNESPRHLLRLLCSVLNCCTVSNIFPALHEDSKELFYSKVIEWALSEECPENIYSTYILGHIVKDNELVVSQREASFIRVTDSTMYRLKAMNTHSERPYYSPEERHTKTQNMFSPGINGEWNLASPLLETVQERLLIFYLQRVAIMEELMSASHTDDVLKLISSYLYHDHDDIRLKLEALLLLLKLFAYPSVYYDFYDHNGIQWLLDIPRPSIAANAITSTLYSLFFYDEVIDNIILESEDTMRSLIGVVLWAIDSCHFTAQWYGFLCIQCLVKKPVALQIFEELNGPKDIFTALVVFSKFLSEIRNKNHPDETIYFNLLKSILKTMKICLEQSLLRWSTDLKDEDLMEPLVFPCERKLSFPKEVVKAMPAVMKLQSWRHDYISNYRQIIRVIYSSKGIFPDAFRKVNEISQFSLDILCLLCLSNHFVGHFFNFKKSDTKGTVKLIFDNIIPNKDLFTSNHINSSRSILFFISILCCRPISDSRTPLTPKKSSRKRPFDDIEMAEMVSEKVHISDERIVTKMMTSFGPSETCWSKCAGTNEGIQTRLWTLVRSYNGIPKLLEVLERVSTPLETLLTRTWICHILSGMTRCDDILLMMKRMSVLNKDALTRIIFKNVSSEPIDEFEEFRNFVGRLLIDFNFQPVSEESNIKADVPKWDKKELFSLMYHHLKQEGLNETAKVLKSEANLSFARLPRSALYQCNNAASEAPSLTSKNIKVENMLGPSVETDKPVDLSITSMSDIPQTSAEMGFLSNTSGRFMTLDFMVDSYFRNQHSQCSVPINKYSKFSLYSGHECTSIKVPERPINMVHYLTKREYDVTSHAINSRMLRHHTHRNFQPRVVINEADIFEEDPFSEHMCFSKGPDNGLYLCNKTDFVVFTDFDIVQDILVEGDIDFGINNMETTRDGRSLMVSSSYTHWHCAMLTMFDVQNRYSGKATLQHEYSFSGYAEFSKVDDRKFIVTQDKAVVVVDVECGLPLYRCSNECHSTSPREYDINRATLSHDDNLILSYGMLWDIRSSHKHFVVVDDFKHNFDNFWNNKSGVFHPNGYEVIIGGAVWDIRTYKLLQYIPSLRWSRILFNNEGNYFYTYVEYKPEVCKWDMLKGQNLFHCYDSRDYGVVSTVNVNKIISSLRVDPKDTKVAVIEKHYDGYSQNRCRVFNAGYKWKGMSSTLEMEDDPIETRAYEDSMMQTRTSDDEFMSPGSNEEEEALVHRVFRNRGSPVATLYRGIRSETSSDYYHE